jgi:hypothetical protein
VRRDPEPDDAGRDPAAHDHDDELTDDQVAAFQQEYAEARRRVAEAPAATVVVNHAMGLYELGAIHLSAEPPNLPEAALAIDAVACLVDGLGDRLGPEVDTLRDALSQIRLAFVQIKGSAG